MSEPVRHDRISQSGALTNRVQKGDALFDERVSWLAEDAEQVLLRQSTQSGNHRHSTCQGNGQNQSPTILAADRLKYRTDKLRDEAVVDQVYHLDPVQDRLRLLEVRSRVISLGGCLLILLALGQESVEADRRLVRAGQDGLVAANPG